MQAQSGGADSIQGRKKGAWVLGLLCRHHSHNVHMMLCDVSKEQCMYRLVPALSPHRFFPHMRGRYDEIMLKRYTVRYLYNNPPCLFASVASRVG